MHERNRQTDRQDCYGNTALVHRAVKMLGPLFERSCTIETSESSAFITYRAFIGDSEVYLNKLVYHLDASFQCTFLAVCHAKLKLLETTKSQIPLRSDGSKLVADRFEAGRRPASNQLRAR